MGSAHASVGDGVGECGPFVKHESTDTIRHRQKRVLTYQFYGFLGWNWFDLRLLCDKVACNIPWQW